MSLIKSRTLRNEAECGRCGKTFDWTDLRRCATCKRQVCYDCRGSVGNSYGTIYYCSTENSECWGF